MVPMAPDKALPAAFLPYSISGFGDRTIALRTRVPPVSLVNNIRQMMWSMDRDVVLVEPNVAGGKGFSLDQLMQGIVYGKQEFAALAFGACAAVGLALAMAGLFSVMSYIVSLKTHDNGIRLALGAQRPTILRMVVNQGFTLIAIGLAVGILTSLALTRFLSSQFRGISATDPFTLLLVAVTVLIAGLSACFLPAQRATRVDPMATLRNE